MDGDAREAGGIRRFAPLALTLVLLAVGIALPARTAASPGWDVILDRPMPDFRDLQFVSGSEGWLVSGSGLLHSTDGGETWAERAPITGNAIDFADQAHGWVVGPDGAVHRTSDGGETWQEQDAATAVHLRDIEATGPDEAWIVGSGEGYSDVVTVPIPAAFLHTMDGGVTWETVPTPEDMWFNEVEFVGERGWARGQCAGSGPPGCGEELPIGGPTGVLLFTEDGGETWAPIGEGVPPVARSMTFISAEEGWLLADDCTDECSSAIFHTTDGGVTWEARFDASAYVALEDLTFQDALNGRALALRCYDDGCPHTLLTTTDGGASWRARDIGPAEGFSARVRATDAALFVISRGGFSDAGVALRSADGGATWDAVEHPALALSSVSFADTATGYAVSGGHVARTDDAGRTWRPVSDLPGDVSALEFTSATTGVAVARACCEPASLLVVRTEDGGTSWDEALDTTSFGPNSFVHDIEFADGGHGWVALDGGFLFTDDGGRTWREEPLGELAPHLIDADLADADTGWAIVPAPGFGGGPHRLVRTDDAGRTWDVVADAPEGAHTIEFVDAEHGWIASNPACTEAGCTSGLSITTDGGRGWEQVDLSSAPRVVDLAFVDRLNGWASVQHCDATGCRADLEHTADGGHTWDTQLSGQSLLGTLEFVDAETGWFLLDPNRGISIGGGPPTRTVLYHTTDAGGGPVGVEPTATPTVELPDVGTGGPGGGDAGWPLFVIALALAGSLAAGVAGLRRPRS